MAQNPLFPSFGCFTLCHPFPKEGEEQPLFCLKLAVTFLNFLFIGTAHNRCALLMFGFIVCFVSCRTKFNIFSNLAKILFIYLKFPVSLSILQSDKDGYSQHLRPVVSRRRERSSPLSRPTTESQRFSKFHTHANALDFYLPQPSLVDTTSINLLVSAVSCCSHICGNIRYMCLKSHSTAILYWL